MPTNVCNLGRCCVRVNTDLILRSLRSKRLEGWTQHIDSRPSIETRAGGGFFEDTGPSTVVVPANAGPITTVADLVARRLSIVFQP